MNRDIEVLRRVITGVTQLLANRKLKVTQQGSQAFVQQDPRTGQVERVNIPHLPDNASRELILATQGFIDHEVSHILHTCNKVMADASARGPVFHKMWNILEDTYIERKMAERFRGSGYNLQQLHGFFIDKLTLPVLAEAQKAGDQSRVFRILLITLCRAWSGQVVFQDFMKDHEHLIKDELTLIAHFEPRVAALDSSEDCIQLAEEMIKALTPPPPPSPPPAPQPEPEKSEPNGGHGETPEDEGEGTAEPEAEADPDDKGEAGEKEDDAAGAEGGDEAKDETKEGDDEPDAKDERDEEEAPGADADGDQEGGEDDADDAEGSSEPADAEGDDDAGEENDADSDGDDAGDEDGDTEGGDADGAGDADADEEPGDGAASEAEDGDEGGVGGKGDEEKDDDEGDEGPGAAGSEPGDDDDGQPAETSELDDEGGMSQDMVLDDDDGITKIDEEAAPGGGGYTQNQAIAPTLEGLTDLSEAVGEHLAETVVDLNRGADYVIYSRDFDDVSVFDPDIKLPADAIATMDADANQAVGVMSKTIERMMKARSQVVQVPGFKSGRIHAGSLHRLAVNDPRVFRRKQVNDSQDVIVGICVDNSGSMSSGAVGRGRNKSKRSRIETATDAAYALALTLERVGVKSEVTGFTTGGKGNPPWQEIQDEQIKMGRSFSRVVPISFRIIKSADDRMTPEVKRRFAKMRSGWGMGCNIDGESVEIAATRLQFRPEKRKVLLVLSDGQPAGGEDHELRGHLKRTVDNLNAQGLETIGIGIQSDAVRGFYKKNVVLHDIESLPAIVMNELKGILLGG